MFSSPAKQQELEKEIATIDLRISELEPYQFLERGYLIEKKKQLSKQLEACKRKQKIEYEASMSYSLTDLYRNYPEGRQERQSFRRSREAKLKLEIRERKAELRELCKKIEYLKSEVKVIQIERDKSSDDDLSKHYESALNTEAIDQKEEESPPPSPPPQNLINLSMLSGPKLFIPVSFHPCEYNPYSLACMIDSGCQVNLARGSALPSYYWEKTIDGGTAINGAPIRLQAKAEVNVSF